MTEIEIHSHDEIQRLLPWFVNGTLDEAMQQAVREHLQSCPSCHAAYEWASRERAAIYLEQLPVPDVEASLARMRALSSSRSLRGGVFTCRGACSMCTRC